jgi:predicted nucleic acid-binding protein
MILLDTNVLIYASEARSPLGHWARKTIADAVSADGAAINAVSLAEVCVGDTEPHTVADRIRSWGVEVLDIPAAAAEVSALAYMAYRTRRKTASGRDSPVVPLPDFFIGAHAQIMGWTLATADPDRFRTYFPSVPLQTPRR